jgi:hypothetical protein
MRRWGGEGLELGLDLCTSLCVAIFVAVLSFAVAADAASATDVVTSPREAAYPPAASLEEIAPYSEEPSGRRPRAVCPPSTDRRASCMAAVVPVRGGKPALGPALEGSGINGGFSPADLHSAYGLPSVGGADQTVAITIAYDNPKAEADLATYRSYYGLPPCTSANGCFKKVNQDGEEGSYPEANAEWALESSLDLDMVSATCPQCDILLVEADTNFLDDLGVAVETAVGMGATVVSNSWATEEFDGESAGNHYFDHPGIPILFASGDWGYGVEYPAASPDVVAVGGTSLSKSGSSRGWKETAWSGAGSGCSAYEEKPEWQKDEGCAGRTVADVAAVADPSTPVSVYDTFEQPGWTLLGGTSVATPILAGVEALSSASVRAMGPAAFDRAGNGGETFDVTEGENGTCGAWSETGFGATYLCQADVGYDGPTGWGAPDGPLSLPVAITEAAKRVSDHEVVLRGAVDPGGLETEYRFEYGKTTSYGESVPVPDADLGDGSGYVEVNQAVSGLEGEVPYHYRIVAMNSAGTFPGRDRITGTSLPTVTTGPADEVAVSHAVLHAEVDPEGLDTTYYFEYGPSASYGFKAPTRAGEAGSGTEALSVSGAISGLTGGKVYHYRVVAKNVAGVVYGDDATFVTPPSKWAAEDLPQPPNSGNGHYAFGVSCPGPEECVAVGQNWSLDVHTGVTLAEYWDGASWSAMDTPNPPGLDEGWAHDWYASLNGVSCVSLTACVTVGVYRDPDEVEKPLVEVWDGSAWTMGALPWPEGAKAARLSDVSCASATECVAIGRSQSAAGTVRALVMRWDGTGWDVETTPSPEGATDSWLLGVSCSSASSCTGVGAYETGAGGTATLALHWNGSNWAIQSTPNPGPRSDAQLYDVSCPAATACMAVGYYRIGPTIVALAASWDGSEWTVRLPLTPEGEGVFSDVSCATPSSCTAVGQYYREAEDADHGSRPLIERWDGTGWSLLETASFSWPPGWWHEEPLAAVSCPQPETCTAVGTRLAAPAGGLSAPVAFAEHENKHELEPPLQPPLASFSIDDEEPLAGQSVSFDASASSDPDGMIESYEWDFGDENLGTGIGPSHAYSEAGEYTVTLTVTDDAGATAQVSHQVDVVEPPVQVPLLGEKGSGVEPLKPPPLAPAFGINHIHVGRKGRVVLDLRAWAAGRFSADAELSSGRHYGAGAVTAEGQGLFRLKIVPRLGVLRAFADRSRFRLELAVTFQPALGGSITKRRAFVIRP